MRHFNITTINVLFALCFIHSMALGQLSDSFEQGSLEKWTQEPESRWSADTINAINGGFSLHHVFNNTSAGTDLIGLPVEDLHIEDSTVVWSFKVRHGYNPSSSNNWAIWLISTSSPQAMNSETPASGYVVGVNFSGSTDTLKLWKVTNNAKAEVIKCPINWEKNVGTNNIAEIVISRDTIGNWSISTTVLGVTYKGYGYDEEFSETRWLIVNYKYSANYDQLLWIDDVTITGKFYSDTIAPTITNLQVLSKTKLEISFSEPLDNKSLSNDNFSIANSDNKVLSIITNDNKATISFEKQFSNKQPNSLNINIICDELDNCAQSLSIEFKPIWAETGDIIIAEIMADPAPSVGLPEKEYLELHNRTEYSFDLSGWTLGKDDNQVKFPAVTINPKEYLILCSITDTALFDGFGKMTGIKSFPTLNDAGSVIYINDNYGAFIHGVEYTSSWYGSNLKSSGGWSLEMVDVDYPFFYERNWEASSSRQGGTPGTENSSTRENPDSFFRGITNVFPVDSKKIIIDFSESVTFLQNGDNLMINDRSLTAITPVDSLRRSFTALVPEEMKPDTRYLVYVTNSITDFAGNRPEISEYAFGLTAKAEREDITFNELLFNPFAEGYDYIELYNGSDKYINASELLLASINSTSGDTSATITLYSPDRCIMPKSYFVVTTSSKQVLESYPTNDPESVYNIPSLPSMPDDKGHILLMTRELDIIDEVVYSEKMHYSLLTDVEGISLEKLRPDLPSKESSSWHSAAESSGFGTPGVVNSAYFSGIDSNDSPITFSSTRITPDNDGFEDILEIHFVFAKPDNVVSISIYSETGRLVRQLEDNTTVNSNGSFFWDGTLADGTLVNNGIYVLLIEIFSPDGRRETLKKTCSVIRNR